MIVPRICIYISKYDHTLCIDLARLHLDDQPTDLTQGVQHPEAEFCWFFFFNSHLKPSNGGTGVYIHKYILYIYVYIL